MEFITRGMARECLASLGEARRDRPTYPRFDTAQALRQALAEGPAHPEDRVIDAIVEALPDSIDKGERSLDVADLVDRICERHPDLMPEDLLPALLTRPVLLNMARHLLPGNFAALHLPPIPDPVMRDRIFEVVRELPGLHTLGLELADGDTLDLHALMQPERHSHRECDLRMILIDCDLLAKGVVLAPLDVPFDVQPANACTIRGVIVKEFFRDGELHHEGPLAPRKRLPELDRELAALAQQGPIVIDLSALARQDPNVIDLSALAQQGPIVIDFSALPRQDPIMIDLSALAPAPWTYVIPSGVRIQVEGEPAVTLQGSGENPRPLAQAQRTPRQAPRAEAAGKPRHPGGLHGDAARLKRALRTFGGALQQERIDRAYAAFEAVAFPDRVPAQRHLRWFCGKWDDAMRSAADVNTALQAVQDSGIALVGVQSEARADGPRSSGAERTARQKFRKAMDQLAAQCKDAQSSLDALKPTVRGAEAIEHELRLVEGQLARIAASAAKSLPGLSAEVD